MHMADALISPPVGATLWAVTAGSILYCSRRVERDMDERKIPLMGVLGAFIFAVQMINFSIPGTGSSGHLGGGMILSILLGPSAAFLVMASVLTVQAFFFADGGILALGCNIFNLAAFPCFIAYPFIYQKVVGTSTREKHIKKAALLSSIIALQLGALGVVCETVLSGVSEVPFLTFLSFMLPIHLAIGIVEGLVTSAVVLFVWKARPEILRQNALSHAPKHAAISFKKISFVILTCALFIGGVISWYASSQPDGLEWALERTQGKEELSSPTSITHHRAAALQQKTAILPDYNFKTYDHAHPAPGTSTAGFVGGFLTLLIASGIGIILKASKKRHKAV